jgi:hypothetical protein
MNLNEKIDLILKQFAALGDSEVFDNIYNSFDFEHKSDGDLRLVKNKMFEEDLIDTRDSHEMVCFITPNGQEIHNNGGWLKYIELIDKENSRFSELAKIEEDKLRWDAKLSKLKAKTFWPVFIFGILGGLSGAISLYFNLTEIEPDPIKELNYQLYDTRWNQPSSTLELFRTNADSAKTLTDALSRFNSGYQKENYPFARLAKVNFDTAFIVIDNSNYLTQQMGTTGADEYLAKLTFSLTELESINFVNLNFEEGDHAVPGTYERTDFNVENL